MGHLTELAIIPVLTILNGLFSMSETAVVSARKARLQQRTETGDAKAAAALELANSPDRFLSTVQIGITLIGILAGAFGGKPVELFVVSGRDAVNGYVRGLAAAATP